MALPACPTGVDGPVRGSVRRKAARGHPEGDLGIRPRREGKIAWSLEP